MPNTPKHTSNGQRREGLASHAIRRPIGTMAITSVVIVLGFFFLDRLPVDLLPEINYPQIRVTVNYPGTAPEVMEQQITRVLEQNLAATENLIRITGRASEGRTNIELYFDYGTDIDVALQDASRNLEFARTQMPQDIDPPRIFKYDPSQDPVYVAGFSSTMRTPIEVRDWMENELAPQLQALHGVGGVLVAGGLLRELQVIVDIDRLNSYRLTMNDVTTALEEENRDIAAGQVTSDRFDVMAKTDGRFVSVDDIADVRLRIPNSNRSIMLTEVAEVKDTNREERLFVRLNGEPTMQLSITKLPEANTLEVIDNVKAELNRLEGSGFIPADIQYQATQDQSFFIISSIGAVSTAAILGGVLAMLVVLLFLGSLRKSFVIGLSIPIAIMATFAMMGMGNLTLNIMSLGGLALGVGLLLDNAIVMLENIFRHNEELKKSAEDSAHEGAAEVSSAVVASTMTNLAAVLPFLLITGLASMLFGELILTIAFAILASLAAALTLVPMLAALLAKVKYRSGLEESRFNKGFNSGLKRLTGVYAGALRKVLRFRWGIAAGAFLLLGGVLYLMNDLGNEFLPQVDDSNFGVFFGMPSGATPDETNRYALWVEDAIQEMPYVESVFSLVGGHLSEGVINERPGTARFSVNLVPASQRRDMSPDQWVDMMQAKMDSLAIPGARTRVSLPSISGIRTNPAGSEISIGIIGDDIDVLDRIGRDLLFELDDIPGLLNFNISRDDRSPLLQVDVDRERATALGLKIGDIGDAVRTAVLGDVPTRFATGSAEYDIRVMLPRDQVKNDEDLSQIRIFRPNGGSVPLADVASFRLTDGPAHIERENQVRVLRMDGEVNPSITDVGTVNDQIRERIAGYDLPQGYSLIFGGEEEVIRETNRILFTVTLLAIFLVFVVMAVQYERLANPLVILTAVPLALIGVGAALIMTGSSLSAPVLLGVILLVGIVVNNAILLVEYIEIGRQEKKLEVFEAVVDAGSIRFRPILMTTLTTVCGMLPLAIGMGEGSELMRPLAISVVGGLLVSMFLTLFVVPSLYIIINTFSEWLKRTLTGSEEPALQPSGVPANGGSESEKSTKEEPVVGE
ncbi:MAG: efflux RND transporter permease subunit [Balneolaceae bacterium]|nr:MAG: efflux RND transporter permease subunit [Balneolaceae bacterium]